MEQQEFEHTLRTFIRHEPFLPFVVEMLDGRLIDVPCPVAFAGGRAVFISPDDEWVEFACENVRAIRQMLAEAAP